MILIPKMTGKCQKQGKLYFYCSLLMLVGRARLDSNKLKLVIFVSTALGTKFYRLILEHALGSRNFYILNAIYFIKYIRGNLLQQLRDLKEVRKKSCLRRGRIILPLNLSRR